MEDDFKYAICVAEAEDDVPHLLVSRAIIQRDTGLTPQEAQRVMDIVVERYC